MIHSAARGTSAGMADFSPFPSIHRLNFPSTSFPAFSRFIQPLCTWTLPRPSTVTIQNNHIKANNRRTLVNTAAKSVGDQQQNNRKQSAERAEKKAKCEQKQETRKIFRPWDDNCCNSDNKTKKYSPSPRSNTNVEPTAEAFNGHQTRLEAMATSMGRATNGNGHGCIYCGKIYSRKYGLKIHLRTHTGFKPLQCKVCKRAFGDPSNLNKHTRLHPETADPSFKCSFCGKLLVRKRDLDRHLQSRHPSLLY